jgi:hypothetical protein
VSWGGRGFVAARELALRTDAVAARARNADATRFPQLLGELRSLEKQMPENWRADARVSAAFGSAFAELREFKTAIEFYTASCGAERAEASLVAAEQLANLKARYAEQLWRDSRRSGARTGKSAAAADDAGDKPQELFKQADQLLDGLLRLGGTAERWSLKGGLARRRAMVVEAAAERRAALESMRHACLQAWARKKEIGQPDTWYPLINVYCADLSLAWLGDDDSTAGQPSSSRGRARPKSGRSRGRGRDRDSRQEWLDELAKEARKIESSATEFWDLSFLVEHRLVTALQEGPLSGQLVRDLAAEFRAVRRRGASAREIDSVTSLLEFLQVMASAAGPQFKTTASQLQALLDAIV